MRIASLPLVLICLAPSLALAQQSVQVDVGSKAFTESVILGDMAMYLAESTGAEVSHHQGLGGTQFVWKALLTGDVDVYPDYTGTLQEEIFKDQDVATMEQLRAAAAKEGVAITDSLGFSNSYILGMKEELAEELDIKTISDLRDHPDLTFAFSSEFLQRGDGWPSLVRLYALPQKDVRGMDHDLAYRGLESGSVHVIDLYATDAEIRYYKLRRLVDDRKHFPDYSAVFVYRQDLEERAPDVVRALHSLEGKISADAMMAMNGDVKLDGKAENVVSAEFLGEKLGLQVTVRSETFWDRLWRRTVEHLRLVAISLGAAILVAIPLGVLAAKYHRLGHAVLAAVGLVQTIPSLVLLVLMIPLVGIGEKPAVLALFLYSLLPIVRNTHAGLVGIPPQIRESAQALGLPGWAQLWKVELPNASSSILAGIKTSAVINIGTATLGALVGAKGYGQPIFTGIRLDDMPLVLEGAIPAALMALTVQGMFEISERWVVPRGLRIKPTAAG